MKCKNCKHWKELIEYYKTDASEGACSKLAYSDKLSYLIENGEDIHQFITEQDFFCFHFDSK